MKVLNVHHRLLAYEPEQIIPALHTLAEKNDLVWPHENWPRMKLDRGLQPGSKGGHGPIRYQVAHVGLDGQVEFEFLAPKGFNGHHGFELIRKGPQQTEVRHTIKMETHGLASLKWIFAIRWLHDALTEDAFDKLQNYLDKGLRHTPWTLWVKTLRYFIAGKKGKRRF